MNLLVRGWYLYIVLFGLALECIAEYWFSNYLGWLFSSLPFPHGYISIFSRVSFIHYCQYPIWGSINTLLVDTLSVLLVGMWNITIALRVRTILKGFLRELSLPHQPKYPTPYPWGEWGVLNLCVYWGAGPQRDGRVKDAIERKGCMMEKVTYQRRHSKGKWGHFRR